MGASESDNGGTSSGLGGWGGTDTPSYGGGGTVDWSDPVSYGITPADIAATDTTPSPSNADIAESTGFSADWGTDGWASSSFSPTTLETQQSVSPMGTPNAGPPQATMADPNQGPQDKGLGERLGIKFGVSTEDFFNNETKAERDDRMGLVGAGLERIAQTVMSAAPGAGVMMTAAKAIDAVQNKGMSLGDAFKAAAFDIGGGMLAGKLNGAVGQVLGPDVSKAISAYNQFGSLANLANPGSAPAINPGAQAVSYARTAFGVPSLGKPSGLTTPSGDPVQSFGGWSSGSGEGSGSGVSATLQQAEPVSPAAALTGLNTNYRYNLADQVKTFRALAQQK